MVANPTRLDADLAASSIGCPACSTGRLRPWGYARTRTVRGLHRTQQTIRPRRGRRTTCAATQLLLPADLVPRHADTLPVVMSALLSAVAGAGHRTIAAGLDVPADTVRRWLRRAGARAEQLRCQAIRLMLECDPLAPALRPTGSVLGDALNALGHAVIAARLRLGTAFTPWQWLGGVIGGQLLTPTCSSSG